MSFVIFMKLLLKINNSLGESFSFLVKNLVIHQKLCQGCGGNIGSTMTMYPQLALHYLLSRLQRDGQCK